MFALYEITVESEPEFIINYDKSFIRDIYSENGITYCSVSLYIRNRDISFRRVYKDSRIVLWLYKKDWGEDYLERTRVVQALVTSFSGEDYILFPSFSSNRIECTFALTDIEEDFGIDCITGAYYSG